MNKNMKAWLLPAILILVGIAATLWATSTFWFPSYRFEPRPQPIYVIRGDIELFYTVKTVISTINVTLIVFLLLTYVSIYRKTRSEFTIGLIIFSAVFLLNTLASSPFVMRAFGFQPFGLGPFAMLPDLFTLVALAVLVYLTTKY